MIWSGLLSAIDYIWRLSNDLEGEVVSGGDGKSRVDALIPFVHKSHQNGIPLITLHAGNKYLAPMLKAHCVAAENYYLYSIFEVICHA